MPPDSCSAADLLTAYAAGKRDFSGWSIAGGVLINEAFEGAMFDGARFRNCAGAFSSFVNCTLEGVEFTHCIFHGMDFHSSSLSGSSFADCVLDRTDFFMSRIQGSRFTDCSLRSSSFLRANLSDCQMHATNLAGSLFGRTTVTANMLLGPDFADCVVALPHDMAESELTQLQSMGYVLNMLRTSDQGARSAGSAPSPVDPALARSLCALVPSIVDFLQRGGVGSDYLVPLQIVIDQTPQRPGGGVFLSYATEDQGVARQLAQLLATAGLDVWFAPNSMRGGQKLYDQLMREIDGVDRVVLLVTPAAMASHWVQTELRRAIASATRSRKRRVVPVLLSKDDQWRSWTLVDPDSGRDLALELRAGPSYSLVDWENREDKGVSTLRALLEDLSQAGA